MAIDITTMPKLGFGLMRLPETDEKIELDRVCTMADAYIKAGLNYFDTAYVYHGGRSECAVKEVLVKRYPRDAFMVATKLPIWEIKKNEDCDRIFDIQRERAGVDFFDFYLLHAVGDDNISSYEKYDCFNWALKKKEEGQIKHFGCSFHGSPEMLERLLDDHPELEFVQIQLNYVDWDHPLIQSRRQYEILSGRGVPIIIMEPVKGGTLATMKPELEAMYKEKRPDRSIASWALRFAASLPGVMTVLSGMSNEEQMNDNISTFTNFEPLSEDEKAAIEEVTRIMFDIPTIGCTACRYCTDGCPMSINIPEVFTALNTLTLYNEEWRSKGHYNGATANGGKASECIECGQCENVCPQHLNIIELLKEAAEKFEKDEKA